MQYNYIVSAISTMMDKYVYIVLSIYSNAVLFCIFTRRSSFL